MPLFNLYFCKILPRGCPNGCPDFDDLQIIQFWICTSRKDSLHYRLRDFKFCLTEDTAYMRYFNWKHLIWGWLHFRIHIYTLSSDYIHICISMETPCVANSISYSAWIETDYTKLNLLEKFQLEWPGPQAGTPGSDQQLRTRLKSFRIRIRYSIIFGSEHGFNKASILARFVIKFGLNFSREGQNWITGFGLKIHFKIVANDLY